MATLDQENQQAQALKATLDALNAIEPESLVRADVLGQALSFEAGLPVFRRTLGLFKDLSACSLEGLPFEALGEVHNYANQVLALLQQIKNFSVQTNPQNPVATRDNLIQQLRDQWNTYYRAVTPHISYAIRKGTDFDTLEREARGALALQKQLTNEQRTEKDKILAEMQGALERVRQAAAEAGVAQHAIHFKDEAEFHRKQSVYWLLAAVVFASLTIVYALWSIAPELSGLGGATIAHVVELIVPRLIVIIVLTFGLVWSARNFASSRHNFVVNRHRQNALSSFEAFVKGAEGDAQTKTRCYFKRRKQSLHHKIVGSLEMRAFRSREARLWR
jgi:hypothetical protein